MNTEKLIEHIEDAPPHDAARIAAAALVAVYEALAHGVKWHDVRSAMLHRDGAAHDEFVSWAEDQRP